MGSGKKIVPLQFSYSCGLFECGGEIYQRLPGTLLLRIDPIRSQVIRDRLESKICSCCRGEMLIVHCMTHKDEVTPTTFYWACDGCGFFKFAMSNQVLAGRDIDLPFIKEFDSRNEVPSLSQLSVVINQNRDRLYTMDPTRFEVFVGSILRDFYQCEVHHVGRSGDDGIDLIVIVGENPLMVQVKRRTKSHSTEGIEVVKLLFASVFGQGGNSAMVVTTASRFSRPSHTWIANPQLRDLKFQMQLVDVNSLMSMINAVRSNGSPLPWETHWDSHKFGVRYDYSEFQPGTWQHIPLEDGDLLVDLTNQESPRLLAWSHHKLDSCVEITGSQENFQSVQCAEMAFDDLLHKYGDQAVVGTCRVNYQYFLDVESVPAVAMTPLITRWRSLFPEAMVDQMDWC